MGRLLPAWEELSLAGVWVVVLLPAWEEVLSSGKGELPELLLSCFLPQGEGEHLPGRLGNLLDCLLPQGKRQLLAYLPEWLEKLLSCFLPWGEGEQLPGGCLSELLLSCFLPKGKESASLGSLTACLRCC